MAKPVANAGVSPAPYAFGAAPPSYSVTAGASTPSTPSGSTISAYEWFIVGKPYGSSPAFANANVQNPTLNALPSRGTVLYFLVVTDNLGQVSETDPSKAPNSAFARVSIKTEHMDVEIPAAGQRDWDGEYLDLVDAIDAFKLAFNTHTIASHDTTATGAQLNTLVGGGNADSLHTHSALSAIAAVGTLGRVKLASTPADAGNPKALTREIFVLHGDCSTEVSVGGMAGGDPSAAQIMIYVPGSIASSPGLTLTQSQVTLRDGGGSSGSDWEFELWQMTSANYKLNAFVASGAATLLWTYAITKPSDSNEPVSENFTINQPFTSTQSHLVLRCTQAPSTPGAGLSFSVAAVRQW